VTDYDAGGDTASRCNAAEPQSITYHPSERKNWIDFGETNTP
jgi:hypothetical protein